jgi:two-component system, NarL family, sensor histidine kinase DesK
MVSKAGEREAFLLGGPLPARSRAFISVWSLVWLAAVLVAPIVGLAGRHAGRDRLLGAALAAAGFAAVYLAGTWAVMTKRAPSARWPWGWPAVLALYAVGLVATFGGEFLGAFLFVASTAGMMLPGRSGPAGVTAVTAAALVAALLAGVEGSTTAALLLTVFMVGIAMTWIRRMVMLIHELRAAREQVARLAVSDERLRFARDLHDLLGRTLSTIALKSQVARRMVRRDPAAAERELEEVGSLAQRSLAEVREAVGGYRQVTFAGELEGARSALAAAGIEPSIRTEGTPAGAVESVLAWTIREGVTNVIRHSGARRCTIVVRVDASAATVEILDDGPGLPSIPLLGTGGGSGNGLRGLAERLRAAGGRLEAGRRDGGGFRLAAIVPVPDVGTAR